jgi:hypothetical protein
MICRFSFLRLQSVCTDIKRTVVEGVVKRIAVDQEVVLMTDPHGSHETKSSENSDEFENLKSEISELSKEVKRMRMRILKCMNEICAL